MKPPPFSLLAYKAIGLHPGLSTSEKRVAAAILDHYSWRDGRCDPGVDRIADLLELSRRTVLRAIIHLDRIGLITRRRHGGRQGCNSYVPNWHAMWALDRAWREPFGAAARKRKVTSAARSKCQTVAGSGVAHDTQTSLPNQSNEPLSAAPAARDHQRPRNGEGGAGPAGRRTTLPTAAFRLQSFHNAKRAISSADARLLAAERRWWDAVFRLCGTDEILLGAVIEAIDEPLRAQVTEAEAQQRGSGIRMLVQALKDKGIQLVRDGGGQP